MHNAYLNVVSTTNHVNIRCRMSVKELAEIVAVPDSVKDVSLAGGWSQIEVTNGIAYPTDYKEYATTYGSGTFCGSFIRILNPLSSQYTQYVTLALEKLRASANWKLAYAVHPAVPGLYPWGVDENDDVLCWHTRGTPDEWSIVIAARDDTTEVHDGPLTRFLCSVFTNQEKCKVWHEPFTREELIFTPRQDNAG